MFPELVDSEIEALKRAGRQDEALRLQRAGANAWQPDGFSLQVREGVLDLADLDPIVASVQPEFLRVPIVRRTSIWPDVGNGPVPPEFALLAIFYPVVFAFLSELGKDLYRGFRSALFAAYRKAESYVHPLGIEIEFREEGQATELTSEELERELKNIQPNLYFGFTQGMDAQEFDRALKSLFQTYGEIERPSGYFGALLEWDSESGAWVEKEKE